MLAFQHTWKGLLLLASLYTCSGAPLSCDPEGSAACFSSFSQGILRIVLPHLTQNIGVQNANLSFVSQICREYNRTYLPCISPTLVGCPAWSYITYEMTSAAVEYICRSNETMVRDVLACLSVPSVYPAIMACNEAALAATKPCHPAYTWQRCVADITSNVCSVSSNAALNDVIAHSLQPMFDLYPCHDNDTSVTSEPEPEISRETGTSEPEPEISRETGTSEPEPEISRETEPEPEVTSAPSAVCDLISFSTCSAELNQDLQLWVANLFVTGRFNNSDLDTLCRVHYSKYQQCVWPLTSGCLKDTMLARDIMVAAFDFICSADIEELRSTIPCIFQPGFATGLQTCALASSASGMCSFVTNYETCVSNLTSGCTDPAQQVISDLVDNLLKPVEEIFPCDVDVTTVVSTLFTSTTPVTSSFKTTTYITPTPGVVTGGVVIEEVTIPKLPITCFDCNSGTKSWLNPQCTIDGHIEEDLVGKTTCNDRCFAKTNKWNEGVIFRGCAAGFWIPEARPLPRSGCQMIRDEMWCFCDHDNCNEMSMARFV